MNDDPLDPRPPRRLPGWATTLLIVLAVLVVGFGICVVALSGSF